MQIEEFFKKLNHFAETKLIKNVGKKVLKLFLLNYTKESYYDGGVLVRWKDRKKDTGKKILYKTGALKKGFVLTFPTADIIRISNSVEYGKYHNEGTEKMPKRPFLYTDKKIVDFIETEAVKEIEIFIKNNK